MQVCRKHSWVFSCADMTDTISETEIRRTRWQYQVAAIMFAGCAVALPFLPVQVPPAVKWTLAGFNGIIALAVVLYGRSLKKI
jgi:hypothetical protein